MFYYLKAWSALPPGSPMLPVSFLPGNNPLANAIGLVIPTYLAACRHVIPGNRPERQTADFAGILYARDNRLTVDTRLTCVRMSHTQFQNVHNSVDSATETYYMCAPAAIINLNSNCAKRVSMPVPENWG